MIPSSFFIRPDPEQTREVHGLYWRGPADTPYAPLICVHGLTRNAWDFARVAEKLAETRDVIALDMAGRGLSDKANENDYTYVTYVADCLSVVKQLNRDAVGSTVDWLGTSMGGIIGMLIAAQHKGVIGKLILNDVGPFIPKAALMRIAEYVGTDQDFGNIDEALRYCRATYADFGIRDASDWWRFTLTTLRRKKDGRYGLHYDVRIANVFKLVTGDIDMWPVYRAISAPTLLLRGARSDLLRAEDAERMTLEGPKAKLVTFEGVGHAPALMDEGQVKVIQDFLET